MKTTKLVWTLLIVSTVVLGLIFFFILTTGEGQMSFIDKKEINETIRFTIINDLLHLFFIVIIGGLITLLFKWIEEDKRQGQIRIEIRTEYLKRLGRIYRNVKQVRRMLRTAGLTTKYGKEGESTVISGELKTIYLDKMKEINDLQLELEELKIDARALPPFVQMKKLENSLDIMENYLGEIVSEYEKYCPKIRNNEPVSLKMLTCLDEFTGEDKKNFKESFSEKYAAAIGEISKNLE